MNQRTFVAAGAAATAVTAALLATASAASAADPSASPSPSASVTASPEPSVTPEPQPDIHAGVMMMLLGASEEIPIRAFVVEDVIVGDGPELTAADLWSDLSVGAMCGDVEVDIDLDVNTVSVTGSDEGCHMLTAMVGVSFYNGPVLEDVALVSDGLFGGEAQFDGVLPMEFMFLASWTDPALADLMDTEEIPDPFPAGVPLGGTSVFSLTFGDTLIEDLWTEVPDFDGIIRDVIEGTAIESDAAAPVTAVPSFTG